MENKIKVLGITKENDANRYLRIEYPLSKINHEIVENKELDITLKDLSKELVKEMPNYDVIVFEWDIDMTVEELGKLQAQGVKLIYSLSDYWEFSEAHPVYHDVNKRLYAGNRVKQLLLLADAVIVTTERLAANVVNYNGNVAILPNFLNPEDYKEFSVKKESNKLRLGLIGSVSHYPDYLLFKQTLNKLASNKNIVENCQFQLCGVDSNNPFWKEIINMFKKKKHIDFITKEYLPLDRYMEFYQDCDVCLMPLEYTEFNKCKSALKIGECLVTNTLPLGSSFYAHKELKGIVVCESPLDYEQSIEKLLDKEYYNNTLEYIKQVNEKDNDWNKRLENTKAVLNTVYNDNLKVELKDCNFYSIKYKDEQVVEYKEVFNVNKETPWRFEYQVFLDKLEEIEKHEGYTGIFSWKLPEKTGLVQNVLSKSLLFMKYQKYDFINLVPRYWNSADQFLQFSYEQHPKLEELLKKVLTNLNKEYTYSNNYTYSNFFILKSELYADYIKNWVIPSLEYMENDIWEEVNVDANYSSNLSKEEFKEITGLDFYNYATFVLERLIIYYIKDKNLSVLNLM